MIESIVTGAIQGLAEWLPISSEGAIILTKIHIFHSIASLDSLVTYALFLHLGTFFAALVYFWKDIGILLKTFFTTPVKTYPLMISDAENGTTEQKIVLFLLSSTLISGLLGIVVLKLSADIVSSTALVGKTITVLVGILLLITGALQLQVKRGLGFRKEQKLTFKDGIVLGLVQAFTVFPGLSRSGMTISALLLRKFDDETAIRLSFLMSMPIVLLGNIIINYKYFAEFTAEKFAAVFSAFLVGLLTIHVFLYIAKKVNFGWFVVGFGILTMLSVLF
jgi:undecaprenyl-diphosphatase